MASSLNDLAPKPNPTPPWTVEAAILAELREQSTHMKRIADSLDALVKSMAVDESEIQIISTNGATWGGRVPEVSNMNIGAKPDAPKAPRSCNRHDDCDAADAKTQAKLGRRADHCYDEDCEDCFGK